MMRGDTPIMRFVIDIAPAAQAGSGTELRWTAVVESHLADSRAAAVEAARFECAHAEVELLAVFAGHHHGPTAHLDGVRLVADGGLRLDAASAGLADDPDEGARVREHVRAPIAGFHTHGEFARGQGASGLRNQTLATLAID